MRKVLVKMDDGRLGRAVAGLVTWALVARRLSGEGSLRVGRKLWTEGESRGWSLHSRASGFL